MVFFCSYDITDKEKNSKFLSKYKLWCPFRMMYKILNHENILE